MAVSILFNCEEQFVVAVVGQFAVVEVAAIECLFLFNIMIIICVMDKCMARRLGNDHFR